MKTPLTRAVVFFALVAGVAGVLQADTPSEMLEKGIYNEETVGNLDEAIQLYRQVLEAAGETQRVAAQARYRLGNCLLKQGKREQGFNELRALVDRYEKHPDLAELVRRVQAQLPSELKLLPPPWKSGEHTTMTMTLAGGQTIGLVGTSTRRTEHDGKDVWQLSLRRFVAGGHNEGTSRIVVDASTNRPLQSNWDHTIFGTSSAQWHNSRVVIKRKGILEDKTVPFEGRAFANDQALFLLRQLPLAVGYKVTIPLCVAFSGGGLVGLEVSVSKMEIIETLVGDFECFRLETNVGQTYWIANVPERYLVQFDSDLIVTLSSISFEPTPQRLSNEPLGFSVELPPGWFYHRLSTDNEDTSGGFRLVGPEMVSATVRVKDKELLDREERESLQGWVDATIRDASRKYKTLNLRQDSVQDRTVDGVPAKTFVIDHEVAQRSMVHAVTLAADERKAIEAEVTTTKPGFDADPSLLDQIVESIELK